jgi:hypothetical protein
MWLCISDVFAVKEETDDDEGKTKRRDLEERRKQRDENQKVIDALRKYFDDASRLAVDGYRLGESTQAVIVLAHPPHVDAVLRTKTITIGARTHAVLAICQIEVEHPFEIAPNKSVTVGSTLSAVQMAPHCSPRHELAKTLTNTTSGSTRWPTGPPQSSSSAPSRARAFRKLLLCFDSNPCSSYTT